MVTEKKGISDAHPTEILRSAREHRDGRWGLRMGSFSEIKTRGNTQGPGADKREDDEKNKKCSKSLGV